ncbi:unnamed protein product [Moneuplotes crassus]|uniref:Uncharacterized protein n=1 Tax=Euplotes crassus TaxID=5936 RepID=A0AAD1XU75_EUPCR|nr:unnamed protein product [Moneuplotes crassus]
MEARLAECRVRRKEMIEGVKLLESIKQKSSFIDFIDGGYSLVVSLNITKNMIAIKLMKGLKIDYYKKVYFLFDHFNNRSAFTHSLMTNTFIAKQYNSFVISGLTSCRLNLNKVIAPFCRAIVGRAGCLVLSSFKISRKSLQRLITSARNMDYIILDHSELEFDGIKFSPGTQFKIRKFEITDCDHKELVNNREYPSKLLSLFRAISECSLKDSLKAIKVTSDHTNFDQMSKGEHFNYLNNIELKLNDNTYNF